MVNIKRAVSLDIGVKNFCIYIETFDVDILHKIENIPKNKRYMKDKTCTPAFRKLLIQVFKEGKKELLDKVDISGKTRMDMLINLTFYLDKHKKLLDLSDFVAIEEQKKENNQARCIEQHCHSYFIFNYLDTKPVIIFKLNIKLSIRIKKISKRIKGLSKKENQKRLDS